MTKILSVFLTLFLTMGFLGIPGKAGAREEQSLSFNVIPEGPLLNIIFFCDYRSLKNLKYSSKRLNRLVKIEEIQRGARENNILNFYPVPQTFLFTGEAERNKADPPVLSPRPYKTLLIDMDRFLEEGMLFEPEIKAWRNLRVLKYKGVDDSVIKPVLEEVSSKVFLPRGDSLTENLELEKKFHTAFPNITNIIFRPFSLDFIIDNCETKKYVQSLKDIGIAVAVLSLPSYKNSQVKIATLEEDLNSIEIFSTDNLIERLKEKICLSTLISQGK